MVEKNMRVSEGIKLESDGDLSGRTLWLFGVLIMVALLIPFLGQEFKKVFLVHPRVLSLVLIVVCFILYFLSNELDSCKGAGGKIGIVDVFVLLFFLAMLIHFHPEKGLFLFKTSYSSISEFPNYKMGRILVNVIPIVLLSRIACRFIHNKKFIRGMISGGFIVGAFTMFQIFNNYGLLASSNWVMFTSIGAFSTIGVSFNILILLIGVATMLTFKKTFFAKILSILIVLVSLYAIFLVTQRTAMVLGLFITIVIAHRIFSNSLLFFMFSMALVAIGLVFLSFEQIINPEEYPVQIARFLSLTSGADSSVLGRFDAWEFSVERFLQNPLGHGFGTFPAYYHGMEYPHNVVMEALFELGVLGGVAVITLVGISVKWVVSDVKINGFTMPALIMIVGLGYAMKAGSFESIGPWIFALYLLSCSVNLTQPVDDNKICRSKEVGFEKN